MGVKNFFKWLRQTFPQSCQEKAPSAVAHHVYVDVNGILHELLHDNSDITNEEQLYARLFRRLDNLIRLVKPSRTLYLAIDGSPPLAKLFTMRARRRKRTSSSAAAGIGGMEPVLSANCITPGLPFMRRLEQALEYYLCERMLEGNILGRLELECAISGACTPAEGEVKCLAQLLRMGVGGFAEDNHIIVSNDADAILATLMQSSVRNISVLRLAQQSRSPIWWSREAFVALLTEKFSACDAQDLCRDVVLLALLCGTDYCPAVCEVGKIWQCYTEFRSSGEHGSLVDAVEQEELPPCLRDGGWRSIMGDAGLAVRSIGWKRMKTTPVFFEVLRRYAERFEGGVSSAPPNDEKAERYLQGLLWQMQTLATGIIPDYGYTYLWAGTAIGCASLCSFAQSRLSEPLLSPQTPQPPMRPIVTALLTTPLATARKHFPSLKLDDLAHEELDGVEYLKVDLEAITNVVTDSTVEQREFVPEVHLYYQEGNYMDLSMPALPSLPLQFGNREVYPTITFTGKRFVGFWPSSRRNASTSHKAGEANRRNPHQRQNASRDTSKRHRFYKPSFFDDPWSHLLRK